MAPVPGQPRSTRSVTRSASPSDVGRRARATLSGRCRLARTLATAALAHPTRSRSPCGSCARVDLTAQMPSDLKCTGPSGTCLVRVKSPPGFVRCSRRGPSDAAQGNCFAITTTGASQAKSGGGASKAGAGKSGSSASTKSKSRKHHRKHRKHRKNHHRHGRKQQVRTRGVNARADRVRRRPSSRARA